jgi:hypothetical protein
MPQKIRSIIHNDEYIASEIPTLLADLLTLHVIANMLLGALQLQGCQLGKGAMQFKKSGGIHNGHFNPEN